MPNHFLNPRVGRISERLGWVVECVEPLIMMALHIPEENRWVAHQNPDPVLDQELVPNQTLLPDWTGYQTRSWYKTQFLGDQYQTILVSMLSFYLSLILFLHLILNKFKM